MNNPNSTSQSLPFGAPQLRVLDPADSADFESIGSTGGETHYMSVSGFLNRIPNDRPWGVNSVAKFGAMVERFAKGLGCMFKSASDRKAGDVQIWAFDVLKAVYADMAPGLRWPTMPPDEVFLLEKKPAARHGGTDGVSAGESNVLDSLLKQLRMLAQASTDPAIRAASATLLERVTPGTAIQG